MNKPQHHVKVVKYLSIDCNCPTCINEPEQPCKTCNEVSMNCQNHHDPEWRGIVDGREEERNRILELLKAEQLRTAARTFDAHGVLTKLIAQIEGTTND
jgi:hypothetical protein